jgi:NAD(P)-dependent dehydrogenase (short-subunit alcohol dehydrogenase family)
MDLLLRQADAGRAVFVSSSSSRSARPYWGLYAASKAALEALVKSYAGEMATTSVRANIFHPGAVRTAMRQKAMPGEDPETLPTPAAVAPRLIDMILPGYGENGMLFDFERDEARAL